MYLNATLHGACRRGAAAAVDAILASARILPTPPPLQITVTTAITAAVESATAQPLSCEHCAEYIRSLASATVLDSEEITTTLISLLGSGRGTRPVLHGLHCRLLECIQAALLVLTDSE